MTKRMQGTKGNINIDDGAGRMVGYAAGTARQLFTANGVGENPTWQRRAATFALTGATAVSVADTSVVITDCVLISLNTVGGTVGVQPHVATITAGVGFTVVGTAGDTSTYNYLLI